MRIAFRRLGLCLGFFFLRMERHQGLTDFIILPRILKSAPLSGLLLVLGRDGAHLLLLARQLLGQVSISRTEELEARSENASL